MISLKEPNKDRPPNMTLLDFPHKKRRNPFKFRDHVENEADKFNKTVKELRIHLNKLSKDNFDLISHIMINEY